MQSWIIKLDGLYYAGEGEISEYKASGQGWYTHARETSQIMLTDDPTKAKTLEGMVNLNSAWERIYKAIRYKEIEVEKVQFIRRYD